MSSSGERPNPLNELPTATGFASAAIIVCCFSGRLTMHLQYSNAYIGPVWKPGYAGTPNDFSKSKKTVSLAIIYID
jgi:hypothetical protein